MKAFSKTLLLLAGMSLLLAGCQKEGRYGSEGDTIRFTAATAAQTKTAYGDYGGFDANQNPSWQRIDWKAGDWIRIASDVAVHRYNGNNWSDYRVVGNPVATGRQSKASIDNPENGNGLVWNDSVTDYVFWAMYPATGSTETNLTDGKLSMTIPSSQDVTKEAEYEFLFARTEVDRLPASKYEKYVTLYFNPAFSAFEINLASLDDEIELVDFTLESASKPLSGSLVAAISGVDEDAVLGTPTITDDDDDDTNDNQVTISFPEGTKITQTNPQVFTLFTLPQAVNDLTLRFNVKVNGVAETRAFPLKNASGWIYFAPFKKHRITGLRMPGALWKLEIDGDVLPWNGYIATVDEHVSVEGKVQITGDIESVYMEVDETVPWTEGPRPSDREKT